MFFFFYFKGKKKKHLKKAHLEIHCDTVVLDYDVYLLYTVLFIYFNLQIYLFSGLFMDSYFYSRCWKIQNHQGQ